MRKPFRDVVMVPSALYEELARMTDAAQLAILRLVGAQWRSEDGYLPADEVYLMRVCGLPAFVWDQVRGEVLGMLRVAADRRKIAEPTVRAEWERERGVRDRKAAGARRANLERWGVGERKEKVEQLPQKPQLVVGEGKREAEANVELTEGVSGREGVRAALQGISLACLSSADGPQGLSPAAKGMLDAHLSEIVRQGEKQGATPCPDVHGSLLGPPRAPFSYETGQNEQFFADVDFEGEAANLRAQATFGDRRGW